MNSNKNAHTIFQTPLLKLFNTPTRLSVNTIEKLVSLMMRPVILIISKLFSICKSQPTSKSKIAKMSFAVSSKCGISFLSLTSNLNLGNQLNGIKLILRI
jgi:hypothetical protein